MSMPYDWEKPKKPRSSPEKPRSSPPDPDDDLPRRRGRIHITARQRGADIIALGGLALHLPHVLASVSVVFGVSYLIDIVSGLPWWIPFGCWILSGALCFHRPFERLLARWLYGLRHPTPEEDLKFRSVWGEVTARAGVDGGSYQLWVEESDEVNALAAAGHIVGVTSHSLGSLPTSQLAGVLAHELGHHTKGHAWASLMTFWYALPGRLAWRLLRQLASRVDRLSVGWAAVVIGVLGAAVVALATATYGLVFLPLATPYLAAAMARRGELRADEHAAGLGFATELMTVLRDEREREQSERRAATATGMAFEQEGLVARLLASHPDVHTRLHHLQTRGEGKH